MHPQVMALSRRADFDRSGAREAGNFARF